MTLQDLGIVVYHNKNCFRFPLYKPICKTFDARGRTIFGPKVKICIKFVEVHWVMLHTTFQGSKPCSFRKDLNVSHYKHN